jgi:hypothetical protein
MLYPVDCFFGAILGVGFRQASIDGTFATLS